MNCNRHTRSYKMNTQSVERKNELLTHISDLKRINNKHYNTNSFFNGCFSIGMVSFTALSSVSSVRFVLDQAYSSKRAPIWFGLSVLFYSLLEVNQPYTSRCFDVDCKLSMAKEKLTNDSGTYSEYPAPVAERLINDCQTKMLKMGYISPEQTISVDAEPL